MIVSRLTLCAATFAVLATAASIAYGTGLGLLPSATPTAIVATSSEPAPTSRTVRIIELEPVLIVARRPTSR